MKFKIILQRKSLKLVSTGQGNFVFSDNSPLRVVASTSDNFRLLKTERYNLKEKNSSFLLYKNKPYRYFKDLKSDYKCKDKTNVLIELEGKGSITKQEATEMMGYEIKSMYKL